MHPAEKHTRNLRARVLSTTGVAFLATLATACGHATPKASSPQSKTTVTSAEVAGPRFEKMIVSEEGTVSMVEREGCMATLRASGELRVACPKDERLAAWFSDTDRVTAGFALEPNDEREGKGPWAKVMTEGGKVMRIAHASDVKKLGVVMRAFAAELAASEQPAPGPASPAGWQMLRVAGPAHVMFGGTPAHGRLEARVSTNGQYLCEFTANVDSTPMRASKSGYLAPKTASQAIDVVLAPLSATGPSATSSFAAGVRGGQETRSNAGSTGAVLERFSEVQDALGDACLPEIEAPAAASIGL